ncbi:hypothetical protein [Microbacterium album]|uniref:Uncharacterized protein n=1 Tax=Microbacterium album TaxID=2053191 RepID=A0A917IIE8_9MICO|nr:hypothetical protein [Microbacterium album]GGH47459.1 hypothetical protein GCM10010921_24200 [Microbacterium album]
MSDPAGRAVVEDGELVLHTDRDKLLRALRYNTRYVAVYALLVAGLAAGIVAVAVTGIGRGPTYLLLGFLLVLLVGSLGMGLWLRARVRGFLRVDGPFIVVSRAGVAVDGIPRIAWGDVLGVIYGDSSENLRTGNGVARWMKNLTYQAGGAQVFLHVGVREPKRYRAAASGPLARYVSALDMGLLMHLDTALDDARLARLRGALRAATAQAGVRYLETSDTRRMMRAASSMATGRPMRRDP